MTPQKEFLELLVAVAEENCKLDSPISLKELSDENSLYAEVNGAVTETVYYGKGTVVMMPVLFLCRNAEQARCMEQLEEICHYFQRLKTYPQGNSFSWLDTSIASGPSKIGRDEDGVYHYSCILNNKIYY